jgi:hypothetical protein
LFGFNDYSDKAALPLVEEALRKQSHVEVCSKSDLFQGEGGKYDLEEWGTKLRSWDEALCWLSIIILMVLDRILKLNRVGAV